MEDLTVEQVAAVHRNLMEEEKGDCRVISEANLLQMVFRANLIGEVIPRAAFVFYSLCAYPPFCEGNEQTAVLMTGQILTDGGYRIIGNIADLGALARGIREFSAEPEDIERWLETNTRYSPNQ
jgi:hypothetical protein